MGIGESETTMERKMEVVILRSLDDLDNLKPGEFIATSDGCMYRSDNDEFTLLSRYESGQPIEVFLTQSDKLKISNGALKLISGYYMSDTIHNEDKKITTHAYLRSFGL